jgi:insulysin
VLSVFAPLLTVRFRFGIRLSFLGISQTLPSYTRRLCRRLVDHHFSLLAGPERMPAAVTSSAIAYAKKFPGVSKRRRNIMVSNLRASTAYEAAIEGIAFFRSCNGAVCFAQGDLICREVDALVDDLQDIFKVAISSNGRAVATPTIKDLSYTPVWKPRSASSCAVPGVYLLNDACGRVPR